MEYIFSFAITPTNIQQFERNFAYFTEELFKPAKIHSLQSRVSEILIRKFNSEEIICTKITRNPRGLISICTKNYKSVISVTVSSSRQVK